jgi:acetyl-CoA acetyltransferase
MGIAPIFAIPKLLSQIGLSKEDIDVFEVSLRHASCDLNTHTHIQINEAFASQFAYCVEELQIPIGKINPKHVSFIDLPSNQSELVFIFHSGGAIAISHPLGMSAYSMICKLIGLNEVLIAGVRQVVTGLAELKRRNAKILCTSMCVGSGMGAAGIFVNEARP